MVSQNRVICYLYLQCSSKPKRLSLEHKVLFSQKSSSAITNLPLPMANQACCSIPPIGQPTAVPEDQTDQAVGAKLCTYNHWSVYIKCWLIFFGRCVWQSVGQARCSAYLRHIRALPADQARSSTPCPGNELPGYYSRFLSWERGRLELDSDRHRGQERQIDGIYGGGSKPRQECSGSFLHHERNQIALP